MSQQTKTCSKSTTKSDSKKVCDGVCIKNQAMT